MFYRDYHNLSYLSNLLNNSLVNYSTIPYSDLEYELIRLASITKEDSLDQVSIKIAVPKYNASDSQNKYWKSGTGYGADGNKNWNITNYIKEQEELQKEANSLCDAIVHAMIGIFEKPLREIPLKFAKFFLSVVHKICSTKIIMRELREKSFYFLNPRLE